MIHLLLCTAQPVVLGLRQGVNCFLKPIGLDADAVRFLCRGGLRCAMMRRVSCPLDDNQLALAHHSIA